MPKITDTEINIKLPGGTRGIKGHPGPVGPVGPQGEPGVQGNKGIVGPKGEVGEIPTFSIGSMTIGTPASITTTGTPENNILNMVIPKGQKGDTPDSPEISFSKSGKKTTMTVDIGETTKTYEMDDGVDPSVSVSKTGNDTTITTNMYGVSKSTIIPDGEHQFTAGEGISIENREVSDTNYDYIYGDATQEHSGTSFVIEKGLETPIDSIELKGDAYQYTTTGKNSFNATGNVANGTYSNGVYTSTNLNSYQGIGIYGVEQTYTSGTKYYISADIRRTSGTGSINTINNGSGDATIVKHFPTISSTFQRFYVEYTPNTNTTQTLVYIQNNSSCVLEIKNVMVSTSSDTTYEPYTNGASPNPDYPQDIHVVTGDNTIVNYLIFFVQFLSQI